MADHEHTLTKLSVDISSADDAMTAVVNWTAAGETYKVTLPAVSHDEMRQILARIGYALSGDPELTRIVGGNAFTVGLIR